MADISGMLDELQSKAVKNEALRNKLVATREAKNPLEEFCKAAMEEGYEIYPMDLVCAGEELYASMKRSTNGGGENSPMLEGQDDLYELFLAAIKQ
jgi:hypothetical protein